MSRLAFCAIFCIVGCASSAASDPASVLRAYSRALSEGRADDAYAMLSESARQNVSLPAFRKMMKEHPEDARELAAAFSRPVGDPRITAKVGVERGYDLELVMERGRWKLDVTSIDLYAQDTARHAVIGFTRALRARRYDVLMRFVPDGHREGLDPSKLKAAWEGPDKEDVARLLESITRSMHQAVIEENGDRATLVHSTGSLQLVRERGVWKVENFD